MGFRIAKDRLTEDIIVALGSGMLLIVLAPVLLCLLGLEVRSKGGVNNNEEMKRLEQVVSCLERLEKGVIFSA